MRTLTIMLLFAATVNGQERTWTIATDIYTAQAELLGIRGDIAYLRMGGRVEQIPIVRLSAADQQYIASLSLAPVPTGPALTAAGGDTLPVPPAAPSRPTEVSVFKPTQTPAASTPDLAEALPLPGATTGNMQGAAPRTYNNGTSSAASPSGGPTRSRSANTQSQNANNSNARRYLPQQPATNAQRNQQDDSPGILGFRARRADRQRGR
jgi:hypothetical protein